MIRYCEVCNNELEDWEDGICENCQASIIISDDIDPTLEDF